MTFQLSPKGYKGCNPQRSAARVFSAEGSSCRDPEMETRWVCSNDRSQASVAGVFTWLKPQVKGSSVGPCGAWRVVEFHASGHGNQERAKKRGDVM